MSRQTIIPCRPEDGLDYSLENMFQRIAGKPATGPILRFGTQFEANETFWNQAVTEMRKRRAREEDLAWLRTGRKTLAQIRRYLTHREVPVSPPME